MSKYRNLIANFLENYEAPVVEDYIQGFSGIDPQRKVNPLDIDHEQMDGLLGGGYEGHYHLTREQLDWIKEQMTIKYPPVISNSQVINAVPSTPITNYKIQGEFLEVDMAKNITNVAWSATSLPTGLSINASTGVISGTPSVQPGNYTAKVKVVTNYGDNEKDISVVIAIPEEWKPEIESGQVIDCVADEAMTAYTVRGTNVTKTS